MKRFFAIIITALLLTTSVFAYSGDNGVSFTVPEGFTELTEKNIKKNEDALKLIGHSAASFKKYLSDGNILMYAITSDNKSQIALRRYETDFSAELNDLSDCKDEDVRLLAESIAPKTAKHYLVTVGGIKYIQIISGGTDSGGDFSSAEYVTVKNGALISCTFSYSEKGLSKENLDKSFNEMKNLTIKQMTKKGGWTAGEYVLFIGGLLFLCVIIAILSMLLYSFYKDFKKAQKEKEEGTDIKIKRRKF